MAAFVGRDAGNLWFAVSRVAGRRKRERLLHFNAATVVET